MERVLLGFVSFVLSVSLVAQQNECPPTLSGSGFQSPSPWMVNSTFTPGDKTPGACVAGSCKFDFEINIEIEMPYEATNPGTFQFCIVDGGPNCFPTMLPEANYQGYAPPPYEYTFSYTADNWAIQCNTNQELSLHFNPGLGFIQIAQVLMICGFNC